MTCRFTPIAGGMIVSCSRERYEPRESCELCKAHEHVLECDFKLRGDKIGQLCSRKMCRKCAVTIGTEDFCPLHAKMTSRMVTAYTSRINFTGEDRLDVTRKSAGPDGIVFAPSWSILRPMIALRRSTGHEEAWPRYVEAYKEEMRTSYRNNREQWRAVMARQTVTLVCYCVNHNRCHRTILAGILERLGAINGGERA